jgi:crotonobetainyl-CoA:carnitine CoA-transferase CaiB-like acyl-CoA transferase
MPQTALIADVAALFATRSRDDWTALLTNADCCYQAVLDYDEVARHPHICARGLVRREDDHIEVLLPIYVDGAPPAPRTPFADGEAAEVLARWRREA